MLETFFLKAFWNLVNKFEKLSCGSSPPTLQMRRNIRYFPKQYEYIAHASKYKPFSILPKGLCSFTLN